MDEDVKDIPLDLKTALAIVEDVVEFEAEKLDHQGAAGACIAIEYREAIHLIRERTIDAKRRKVG